jgi:hypothetical protein
LAAIETTLVKIDAKNSEEQQEEKRDQADVTNEWDCIKERVDGNLQTRIPGHHS